ncbi:Csu type fimbrial protein [Acinetobacter larvae]|uniref:Spore coat protein U/FanG domain-containing protein n=1 Tax=Acinetobacter larvae TaxID=1789224 RepID=A0A1B2LVS4_9GAMM|nr:spore coat U domain-containing protein [Acinetobacter larvae]AOA57052.1 hypothetical protein BFG52_00915 [Acinetobacter larvae]
MKNIYCIIGLCGTAVLPLSAWAECKQSQSDTVVLEATPSIKLHDEGLADAPFNSGLSCTGLGALNDIHIKYEVHDMPLRLWDESIAASMKIDILDIKKNPVQFFSGVVLSEYGWINLFTGPNNSVKFFVNVPAGQSIRPGNYVASSPFRVQWYYSVPAFAAAGLGFFHESPGFKRGAFNIVKDWGSGVESTVNIKITVTKDCRIVSNDVNFGTAPFAHMLQPVKSSVGVRCSSSTPYSVGLSDGQNYKNNRRNMRSGSNYMGYELYKGNTTARWGSAGQERWLSQDASANAAIYDGLAQQRYDFVAKILEGDNSQLPAGDYNDNISIEVKF